MTTLALSLSKDEARSLTDEVKADATTLWLKLLRLYDGKAHTALGYTSWGAYFEVEFGQTSTHGYRLLAAARAQRELSHIDVTGPSNAAQVITLTDIEEPEERQRVWNQAVETYGEQPTRKQIQQVRSVDQKTKRNTFSVADWQELGIEERKSIVENESIQESTFNRTNDNVEWALWTWNPVTGCLHDCPYCYARDIANRFYEQKFEPTFLPSRLGAPRSMKVPLAATDNVGEKNVFVCSMADLFGKWVPQDWINAVFDAVLDAPQWNFLFLTKFPQRLAEQDWPENAWCGTTVDTQARVATAQRAFAGVKAGVRWLSCEPMMERLTFDSLEMFDWIVIGGASASTQTPAFQPPFEWIEHLHRQARDAGCDIYWKPNLQSRPREYPLR